jgi:hypothetical protein
VPVVVLLTGFALHRNVLHRASIAIPLMGLALHQHALCRLSLAWLGFHTELSVWKGQLLIEMAPCLCDLVEPCAPLVVGAAVVQSWLRFGAA